MAGAADAAADVQLALRSLEEVFAAQHALLVSHYDAWCMVDVEGQMLEAADLSYFFTVSAVPAASLTGKHLQDIVLGSECARVVASLAEAEDTKNITKLQTSLDLTLVAPVSEAALRYPAMDVEISVKAFPGLEALSGVPTPAALGMPWARGGLFVGFKVLAMQEQEKQQQEDTSEPDARERTTGSIEGLDWCRQISASEIINFDVATSVDSQAISWSEGVDTDTVSACSEATWFTAAYSMTSAVRGMPRLPIDEVPLGIFAQEAEDSVAPAIRDTVRRMIEVAAGAEGGCALAVAAVNTWEGLRDRGAADYQIVDRGDAEDGEVAARWENGYMNARVKGTHCHSQTFADAVREFSVHTEKDRWPAGHEADGLPKDGFVALLSPEGYCLKSAVRLVGLPVPPYSWDRVGTRHYSALSLAWALRSTPSAVVVRSDSGSIHCISFDGAQVAVVKTRVEA